MKMSTIGETLNEGRYYVRLLPGCDMWENSKHTGSMFAVRSGRADVSPGKAGDIYTERRSTEVRSRSEVRQRRVSQKGHTSGETVVRERVCRANTRGVPETLLRNTFKQCGFTKVVNSCGTT